MSAQEVPPDEHERLRGAGQLGTESRYPGLFLGEHLVQRRTWPSARTSSGMGSGIGF